MLDKLVDLQNTIGYSFENISLLRAATTHKSYNSRHYEKLEFLGDSILNYCISSQLFAHYPKMSEGDLSLSRSKIVNKTSLSQIGRMIEVDEYIRTERNQRISTSIRADVVEAIIGALYLDGSMKAANLFINRFFLPFVLGINQTQLKDAKSSLQEHAHQINAEAPVYEIVNTRGKQHEKVYEIKCTFNNTIGLGSSKSKRGAEKLAAQHILNRIQEEVCE